MTPEQYKRVTGLFLEARELETAERRAFLDRRCGRDEALRAAVEELLTHDRRPLEFTKGDAIRSELEAILAEDTGQTNAGRHPSIEHAERVGAYRILEPLGEGGFGVVYAAEQTEPLRRLVALKVIKLGMDTKQVIARFEAERQALAMMDHPNIARVLDAGTTDRGRPYFVMELVRGVPITEFCDQNKLDTNERLRLFIKVCDAVQHAHQKGIIHRDLKPSNVLVGSQERCGLPKVIDFGIAKAVHHELTERTLLTEQGQLIGTPEYMSPEQAEMSGADVDTRTDIYTLGVLLYELLTGVTPFDRERLRSASYGEIQRIVCEEVPARPSWRLVRLGDAAVETAHRRDSDPVRLARRIRGDLDWIVMKCLEKDRSRRYATANGLAMDIQRHLYNEPVVAGSPGAVYKLRKFVRRYRWPLAANAAIAILTIAGLIGTSIGLVRAIRAREAETAARRRADVSAEELRYQLYASRIEHIARIIETDSADAVKPVLERCAEDLRGWEWERLNWLADRSEKTIKALDGSVNAIDCTRDGNRFLTAGAGGVVRIWDANTCQQIREFSDPHVKRAILAAKFSDDGMLVVTGDDRGWVQIRSASTGELVREIDLFGGRALLRTQSPESHHIPAVALDGTSRRLVVGTRYGPTRVYDVETGQHLFDLASPSGGATAVSFTRDDSGILVGSELGQVSLLRATDGTVLLAERGAENVLWDAALSPDESRIVSLDMDARLWMRDAKTGEPLFRVRTNKQDARTLAFHPAGNSVAVGGADGLITFFDADSGEQVFSLRGHEARILDLSFHPSGKYLLSGAADGTVKRWHLGVGRTYAMYRHGNHLLCLCFAADDGSILFGGVKGGVMRLMLSTLSVESSGVPMPNVHTITTSPDGNRIAVTAFTRHYEGESCAAVLNSELRVLQRWPIPGRSRLTSTADGRRILAPTDGTIMVWDTISGETVLVVSTKDDPELNAVFTRDGRRIISGHQSGVIRVWDADSGELIDRFEAHRSQVEHLRLDGSGDRLVTYGFDRAVRVWDWRHRTLLRALPDCGVVRAMAVSPDGKRLATAGDDLTIRLWDLTRGLQLMTVGRHTRDITDLAFSHDGSTIASCSRDHTLRVWESGPPRGGLDARFGGDGDIGGRSIE